MVNQCDYYQGIVVVLLRTCWTILSILMNARYANQNKIKMIEAIKWPHTLYTVLHCAHHEFTSHTHTHTRTRIDVMLSVELLALFALTGSSPIVHWILHLMYIIFINIRWNAIQVSCSPLIIQTWLHLFYPRLIPRHIITNRHTNQSLSNAIWLFLSNILCWFHLSSHPYTLNNIRMGNASQLMWFNSKYWCKLWWVTHEIWWKMQGYVCVKCVHGWDVTEIPSAHTT